MEWGIEQMSASIPAAPPSEAQAEIYLPPSAADLLESMRAIGYSFSAALADVIDNSVSADAHRVEVHFSPYGRPFLAVLDDGWGMSPSDLTAAMRHGSRNPRLARESSDLGRFGLGLKTASLSQCRCLTVVSLRAGELSARCWDLDHIAARQDWMLLQLSSADMNTLPLIDELRAHDHGTLVLWEHFDSLVADGTPLERALGNRVDLARDHLALVFHRFLNPPLGTRPVAITINRNPLPTIDPFLTAHKATQTLPIEDFILEGERVTVAPFILPHFSKLSDADRTLAGGEDELRRNQGFYIYRNRRLISWGSWFRLVRQEELTKLARVHVDISNRLDHLWQLDIKKSTTYPPESLREGLRQIINRITEGSRRVYTYRGRKAPDEIIHAWERTVDRDGVAYRINREHPLIAALDANSSNDLLHLFGGFLRLLEDALPFDAIYADMASELRPQTRHPEDNQYESLLALAQTILGSLGRGTPEGDRFLTALPTIEPFCNAPDSAQAVLRALSL
ncbi:MAG TPA: ATP-binding protein [Terriglobia bacterium]|nr:ATP-binding protein [Terriglobia bacterium]